MDKLKLIAFILLTLGIIFDGVLILFFLLSISSLIILSLRRIDVIRVFLSAMLIGFLFEKLGLTTGFPFGHYAYHFPPYLLGVFRNIWMGNILLYFISSSNGFPVQVQNFIFSHINGDNRPLSGSYNGNSPLLDMDFNVSELVRNTFN